MPSTKLKNLWKKICGRHSDSANRINEYVDSRDCGLVDAVKSGWFQNETDELFKGFKISAEDTVLDFGCGAGAVTLFCARRGAHVIFADMVDEKIDSLKKRVMETPARKAEGLISSDICLPLPSAYATKVVALEVLEHLDAPKEMLVELVRIAKPGAQFLLSVPASTCERIQTTFAPEYYFRRPNHIHIFDQNEFESLVKDSGLIIETYTCYGFYWSIWMLLFWVSAKHKGIPLGGVSHDVVNPPYPPLLDEWAKLWRNLLDMPESAPMRKALDELLPKSQVIIARKPI